MKVTYILVTYNRLDLLKQTLSSALNMDEKFDKIIVVNNNSSDGTYEYLQEIEKNYSEIDVINCERNMGGSGGFSLGVKHAMEKTPDNWLFLADDDAIPQKDMLKNLKEGYKNAQNKDEIAALCTSVLNSGKIDTGHRARVKKGVFFIKHKEVSEGEYSKPFYVDIATFVGLLVKPEVVKKISIPESEFFIYYDDSDYCMKINGHGKILCVPSSKIDHNTKLKASTGITWREYYATRNSLIYVKNHFGKYYLNIQALYLYVRRCSWLSRIIKKRSKADVKIIKDAITDAKKGKLGIHEVYHP